MRREVWLPIAAGFFLFGVVIPDEVCRETLHRTGIGIPQCADGDLRQTAELQVSNLRRGGEGGQVTFQATAHYTIADADAAESAPIRDVRDLTLSLIDARGTATPLAVDWSRTQFVRTAPLVLPDVPDGDYRLRATYETPLGHGELEVAVPLYTPARIHVLTDRPLYEPGNVVQFRAVALRARDLGPLDGRPGRWIVTDPAGEVLLEEQAPAESWGVVAGSFPLDREAPTGTWKVAWVSADARDEIPFTVEPFTLPRFRVEAAAARASYGVGEEPRIQGAVKYSSGAPVAGAKLDITWQFGGSWPPPTEWQAELLPKQATAAANGRFELAVPRIPGDLQGTATITARISAIDPGGDRVDGAATILLARDGIAVSSVTELAGGLVSNFNNRLFLRVTTPDGRVLASTKLRVKKTWEFGDRGVEAVTDEDGVASLQIDPGAPVNIVIPAAPWRPAPRSALVSRGEATDVLGAEGASLADQVELDRWLAALAPCAKYATGDASTASLGLRVAASGELLAVGGAASALDRCAIDTVRGRRLPAGPERLYTVAFEFTEPDLPAATATVEAALGDAHEAIDQHFAAIGRSARDCLPRVDGDLPNFVTWRIRAGSKRVEIGPWARDAKVTELAAARALECLQARTAAAPPLDLAEPSAGDQLGVARFAISVADPASLDARPQPTTMLGYELDVATELDGKPVSTTLRIPPGAVPDLRLRVAPVVAKRGETVVAQLIRGPDFTGTLPKELEIECPTWRAGKLALDDDHRVSIELDPNVSGWCEVRAGAGATERARIYVRPEAELAVSLAPAKSQYKPGDRAELALRTLVGGAGRPAAVGLFGVDDSLAQLVPLPGPDSLARLLPQVTTSGLAFDALDGQALALGRIRGANAAAATVLRVASIPAKPALDAVVTTSAHSRFDPVEELTDRFYVVLAELHAQARRWEATAPAAEKMRPPQMAQLWRQALAACEARGERVTDAFGRPLALRRLPPDLLSLVDPRAVIVRGTRLPEDVENWTRWVATERP